MRGHFACGCRSNLIGTEFWQLHAEDVAGRWHLCLQVALLVIVDGAGLMAFAENHVVSSRLIDSFLPILQLRLHNIKA